MFINRTEAGKKIAQKLETLRDKDAIVVALPRGGVVVGYQVARAFSLPLDIIATRKIGHPSNPEYAIGAVDEHGTAVFNEAEVALVDERWLEEEVKKQKNEARRRTKIYRKNKKQSTLIGKIAIIVDDGIATGFTMRLAVKAVKKENPKKIIIAVPVAPPESINEIKSEGADEIIVLEPLNEFLGAVGAHYQEFEQVSDRDVIKLLQLSL